MAKNNHVERATIQLVIDGKQAESTIKDIRQAMIMLERTLVNMPKSHPEYEKTRKELNLLKKANSELWADIKKAETNHKGVIDLIIGGKKAKTSIVEVEGALQHLERQLKEMRRADDPGGFDKLQKELNQTRAAHGQMMAELRGGEGSWTRFKSNWKEIALGTFGGNLGLAAVNALRQGVTKLITTSGELSDELGDIQKKTNLAGAELDALNEAIQNIDTRTSREELRALAAEAGALGYTSQKDVLDFVKAANMLNVALGEDLGEGATKEIAKITEIFKLKDQYGLEGSMLRVGSAINAIGMASTANEGYIVDFVKRMSGISGIAKVSVQELVALGGTLDSLGQTSEVSSTALNKLLVKMGGDVKTYSKMAGVSMEEFRKVLDRSALEGLMMVLKQVGKTSGGIEQLSATLGDLGLDGGRVVAVLGTLSKNTEEYSRQLGISTSEFEKNTSIQNEYNIRNENTAAILEKISKKFSLMWEQGSKYMGPLIELFGKWVGVVRELDLQMERLMAQQKKVADTEKNLLPLIGRYDALATTVKRSAEEQAEFEKINKLLADAIPGAVTQWDAYGNAISVNTWKVREFAEEQRKLLEVMQKQQREDINERANKLKNQAAYLQNQLNSGKVAIDDGFTVTYRKMTQREFEAMRKELAEVQAERMKMAQEQRRISGVDEKRNRRNAASGSTPDPTDPATTPPGSSPPPTKEEEKDAKKAATALDNLRDELLKAKQQITQDSLTEGAKEIQAAVYKYEALRKKAKGHAEEMARIDELEKQDLAQIRDKYIKKDLAEFDKAMRGKLKSQNANAAERNAAEQKQAEMEAEFRFGEVAKIEAHYMELIVRARQLGLDTTGYYQMMAREINDVRRKQAVEEIKTEEEKQKKLTELQKKALDDELANIEYRRQLFSGIVSSISDLLSIMAHNETDFAEFQKALALVQLAIDTGAAIAAGVAKAAAFSGVNPLAMAATIAATVATITANILKGKKLIEKADPPAAPAFRAAGGYTDAASLAADPGGWVSRPTLFNLGRRSYVAGEAGAEYVLSNPMLRDPAVANFVGIMESLRTQNQFGPAGGGLSQALGQGGRGPAMDPQLAETNRLLRALVSKPDAWNYSALEEYRNTVDGIRGRASA